MENRDFGLAWSQINTSEAINSSWNAQKAFQYSDASSLGSYPYFGNYKVYLGGGFAYRIFSNSSLSQIRADLSSLQINNWIDKQTRAVFIEFTVFNPNLNLFAYCTILFEYLETGNICISFRFNPISLYADETALTLAGDILFLFITAFLVIKEIIWVIKKKSAYLREPWSYVNWIIYSFSVAFFSLYMHRVYEKYHLIDKLKSVAESAQIISFHWMNYLNDTMLTCLAMCCFLTSVKFFQILGFSRNIRFLVQAFQVCLKEILAFLFFYAVLLYSFVTVMYLVFIEQGNKQFRTLPQSLYTSFSIQLGKFSARSFETGFLGPIIFVAFNSIIVFLLINLFICILCSAFSKIRKDYKKEHIDEDSIILNYLKRKTLPSIRKLFGIGSGQTFEGNELNRIEYTDTFTTFEQRTAHLAHFISIRSETRF